MIKLRMNEIVLTPKAVKRPSCKRRREVREAVCRRDSVLTNGVRRAFCMWCKKEVRGDDLTVEHILPLSLGGTYDMSNLGIACRRCNIGRMKNLKR